MDGTPLVMPLYPDAKRPTTFDEGLEFQDFVRQECEKQLGLPITYNVSKRYQYEQGEGNIAEIKLDSRCYETERLSIEIAEKSKASNPCFIPSGIYGTTKLLYIQGNYDLFFIFSPLVLIFLHCLNRFEINDKVPTLRSYFLPFKWAFAHAMRPIGVTKKGKATVESMKYVRQRDIKIGLSLMEKQFPLFISELKMEHNA